MGLCSLSLSTSLRILQAVFCGLALLIPLIRGLMRNSYGVWCEFVWVLGLIVAVAIYLLEKFLCDKILELIVLQHTWSDLTCGLSLEISVMLLSGSVIYSCIFVCSTCVGDIFCAIFSILAFVFYTIDAVKTKLKCPNGYLSSARGLLRFSQGFVACILVAAVTDYFMGVERRFIPVAMAWCIVVYVVCFPVCVLIILIQLIKCLRGLLCCAMDKLEMIFDIVAVVLYLSAAVIWPIYAYKNYRSSPDHSYNMHSQRFNDLNVATVLTYVNLCLYVADLIWLLVVQCKGG